MNHEATDKTDTVLHPDFTVPQRTLYIKVQMHQICGFLTQR